MDNSIKVSFLENEIKLAQYYTGLRDKIGALNVAFVGFILSIYKTASENEVVFFHLLIALGFFSFAACLRAGIAYDYHFNNYETFLKNDGEFRALIEENRKAYKTNKGLNSLAYSWGK